MSLSYTSSASVHSRRIHAFFASAIGFVLIGWGVDRPAPREERPSVSDGNAALLAADSLPAKSARDLAGLWQAKRRFGPDLRGPILLRKSGNSWWAEIGGKSAQARIDRDEIEVTWPGGEYAFRGRFQTGRSRIVGHWIRTANNASPVTLTKDDRDVWRGDVVVDDDMFTFYLVVTPRNDGSTGAFLRNPERNVGFGQYRVDHIELAGESVRLFGPDKGVQKGREVATGTYDKERDVLSIYLPNRGGTFDFARVGKDEVSDFYPRGRPSVPYTYAPPAAAADGWPTASLEDVGISRGMISQFIQMIIDTPIDSVSSPELHAVLIARHGKLVLEEYFHGENCDKLHDSRSAAKSLTATLIGAAIHAGVPLTVSSPVYQVMNDGKFPPDLETRKRSLTLEHLLTMSSGLDCDDNDPNSPGREDYMTDESGATDYYQYTMALKMIREPGEKSVYCSVQPNLAGGVLKHAAGRSLPDLMRDLIAVPLQIKRYSVPLTPNGDSYMGGGVRFLTRDFLKLAQLHMNGGTWNGHEVITNEWARRATSHLVNIGTRKYGYLWWMEDYPYNGKTIRAFFAAGNGGQISMGIPELDLAIAFNGGNYSDGPATYVPQRVYVPKYILPAVDAGR